MKEHLDVLIRTRKECGCSLTSVVVGYGHSRQDPATIVNLMAMNFELEVMENVGVGQVVSHLWE
jgi:hypothetical protein